MPFINVRTALGLLDTEQKSQLHAELTDVLVRIEGGGQEAFRQYVTVLIEEHPAEAWSVSGQPLTREAISSLAQSGTKVPYTEE